MSVLNDLIARSQNQCELCKSEQNLKPYLVEPNRDDKHVLVCETCLSQLNEDEELDPNHWHKLSETMWSEFPEVQVVIYRLLDKLKNIELLDQMYLEDETLSWAKEGMKNNQNDIKIKDSNGTILKDGDSVTLIKDLDVKGAGFTAKRGTLVKNIVLTDNEKFIEGKVNGTKIVLVAAYLKRVNE